MNRHAFDSHFNDEEDDVTYGAWPHRSQDPVSNEKTGDLSTDILVDDTTVRPGSIMKQPGSRLMKNDDTKRSKKAGL